MRVSSSMRCPSSWVVQGPWSPRCGPLTTWRCPRLPLRARRSHAWAQRRHSDRAGGGLRLRPSAETEVPGLIPGTELRQADVPTSALGNALTAVNVSICFPHAQEAGHDCTPSKIDSKLVRHGPRFEHPPSPEHRPHTHRLERLRKTLLQHVDRLVHAQQVCLAQA